jgi:uncharacterized protein with HEPN domain
VRDDRLLLGDILEAIARIEKYASGGRARFDDDELVQTWIIHNLQIIGEAARKLPAEVRSRASGIHWPEIISMRNILVHDYFGVDLETVWGTVVTDLPFLKGRIQALLEET